MDEASTSRSTMNEFQTMDIQDTIVSDDQALVIRHSIVFNFNINHLIMHAFGF